jgi:hypothetical protein
MYSQCCIDPENRAVYSEALEALIDAEAPFLVGGAFAVHFYTALWRDTRDLDVFCRLDDVPLAIEALLQAGFADIGEQAARDHEWIFHSRKHDIIVDVIWSFANGLAAVDSDWFAEAIQGDFLGYPVAFVPTERLIFSKLFTLNRHRCDWPDIIRIMTNNVKPVEWPHLMDLVGDHWLLLSGLVDVFDWQYPAAFNVVPREVRDELQRRRNSYAPDPNALSREELLDPWVYTREEDICNSAL